MNIAIGLTILLYALSSVSYLVFLFRQREEYAHWGFWLLCAGFALHSAAIGMRIFTLGFLPAATMRDTLLIAGWSVALIFLAFGRRMRIKVLGVCASPLAALTLLLAVQLPDRPGEVKAILKSIWLLAHVVAIFAGEAAFALAAAAGLMYLLQERAIKGKHRGFFFRRLPSLDQLDAAGYNGIVIGFSLFSLALVTGFVYARAVWGRFWAWDPKEVWSGITWLIYAVLLHQRLTVGWRGRRAAVLAIVGFGLVLFTFLGVNFLMEGHHGEFTRSIAP